MEPTSKKDAGNWQKLDKILDKLLKEMQEKKEQVNEIQTKRH